MLYNVVETSIITRELRDNVIYNSLCWNIGHCAKTQLLEFRYKTVTFATSYDEADHHKASDTLNS